MGIVRELLSFLAFLLESKLSAGSGRVFCDGEKDGKCARITSDVSGELVATETRGATNIFEHKIYTNLRQTKISLKNQRHQRGLDAYQLVVW